MIEIETKTYDRYYDCAITHLHHYNIFDRLAWDFIEESIINDNRSTLIEQIVLRKLIGYSYYD